MLCLDRKPGEGVFVGTDCRVEVVEIRRGVRNAAGKSSYVVIEVGRTFKGSRPSRVELYEGESTMLISGVAVMVRHVKGGVASLGFDGPVSVRISRDNIGGAKLGANGNA